MAGICDTTLASSKHKSFVCIECGCHADSSYEKYPGGTIKLTQCNHCKAVVDKYIEYDNVIILLDILLHKSQAYRHLLFNIDIKAVRQLLVLSILCDTYMRWTSLHQLCPSDSISSRDWHLVLELQFYAMLGISTLELFVNIVVTSAVVSFANHKKKIKLIGRLESLPRILLLSSYGKLLALAALVWNPENSYWYLALTRMFVLTSNAEAIKVISKRRFLESISFVACGALTGYLVQDCAVWVLFQTENSPIQLD